MKKRIAGANPFMPLWEHVPDGEPHVFTYNGEERVYLYGSHDTLKTEYCGKDYVVWSAPVDDLTDWKCHGVCYTAFDNSVMYAPDVAYKDGTYYLYVAHDYGSKVYVAKSDNPAGPFENPVLTELGFDPGILVDDDGKVYAYWGFCKSFCAELNDDMATIKKETLHEDPIGYALTRFNPDREHANPDDGFFEASSPRKIMGKYVYIYSKMHNAPVEELGTNADCNGFLSYKYSDKPLSGFKSGGDISFNGGEIVKLDDGSFHMTYQWGNNHGSLCEINGKWYIFYHRQTGVNEFSRQAMLEPVDVALSDDGHIFIGKIHYENSGGVLRPVRSTPVEMTSSGAMTGGIDAYSIISAGYACHIFRKDVAYEPASSCNAYIKPVYLESDLKSPDDEILCPGAGKDCNLSTPVVNIKNGYTVGFRYIYFGENNKNQRVNIKVKALSTIIVNLRLDSYDGEIIASVDCPANEIHDESTAQGSTGTDYSENADIAGYRDYSAELCKPVNGRQAVYFEFVTKEDVPDSAEIARFLEFDFDR